MSPATKGDDVTQQSTASFHVRWMIRRDMSEVMAIEQASYDWPWTEEDFLRAMRQRNVIGMVATREPGGEPVVGYMVYAMEKMSLDVLNFAVAPAWRHQGVATAMVAKLQGKLASHRRNKIRLECRETNMAALMFFKSQDFIATAVLRDHYDDTDEDAIRMVYRLPKSAHQ